MVWTPLQASPTPYDWSEDMPTVLNTIGTGEHTVTVEEVQSRPQYRWRCACGKKGLTRNMRGLAETDASWHWRWHQGLAGKKDPAS
jgi:hypothetical protein